MFSPGQVVSHAEMCQAEGKSLQQGMHFHGHLGRSSIVLMSRRSNAPYADRVEDGGRVLIYEGHNAPRSSAILDPSSVDQPARTPKGSLTQNGRFLKAAEAAKRGGRPEVVRVYEKIRDGVWTYNGEFDLLDGWTEDSGGRKVFKFKLKLRAQQGEAETTGREVLAGSRLIPGHIKVAVWKRDQGRCVECGATDNLHFDHVIPFSRGGSSLVASNVQLLCARHNLLKRDKIQ